MCRQNASLLQKICEKYQHTLCLFFYCFETKYWQAFAWNLTRIEIFVESENLCFSFYIGLLLVPSCCVFHKKSVLPAKQLSMDVVSGMHNFLLLLNIFLQMNIKQYM